MRPLPAIVLASLALAAGGDALAQWDSAGKGVTRPPHWEAPTLPLAGNPYPPNPAQPPFNPCGTPTGGASYTPPTWTPPPPPGNPELILPEVRYGGGHQGHEGGVQTKNRQMLPPIVATKSNGGRGSIRDEPPVVVPPAGGPLSNPTVPTPCTPTVPGLGPNPVPEPGTLALLAVGLLGLAVVQRKRRARAA